MMRRSPTLSAALLLFCLGAAGCAFLPRTAPAQFYLLSFEPAGGSEAPLPIAVGVGPVQLPGFLDRPQIATRSGPNQVDYSEIHRWAQPLQQAVTSVLMADLGSRLHSDRITAFPFALGLPRDYDVSIDFLHFESSTGGEVLIDAIWRVQDSRIGADLFVKRVSLSRSAAAGDFAAAAGALSAALGELADQMALALREVYARR
jgi:uncharacterized lipoprotein YmbA